MIGSAADAWFSGRSGGEISTAKHHKGDLTFADLDGC